MLDLVHGPLRVWSSISTSAFSCHEVGQLRAIDLGSIVLHGIAVLATSLCFLVALERYQINQIRWFEEGFLHGSARLESQEDGWHVAATGSEWPSAWPRKEDIPVVHRNDLLFFGQSFSRWR